MVDVGARIRPLMVDKRRIGWVRVVHLSERRALRRWVTDDIAFVEILLPTALTRDEIRVLNLGELRSLSRLVQAMTAIDLRLYAHISAFVMTGAALVLPGNGTHECRERVVSMPGGKERHHGPPIRLAFRLPCAELPD